MGFSRCANPSKLSLLFFEGHEVQKRAGLAVLSYKEKEGCHRVHIKLCLLIDRIYHNSQFSIFSKSSKAISTLSITCEVNSFSEKNVR